MRSAERAFMTFTVGARRLRLYTAAAVSARCRTEATRRSARTGDRAAMTDISVRGLTKRFGSVTAVRDLTFDVGPGAVTGFLGPNGAGKTTTLRMLLGLVRPNAGTATIGGRRYADLAHPRRVVGAVLEATGFHPGRTGHDHLRILARLIGAPAGRVEDVLDRGALSREAGRRVARRSRR